MLVNRIADYLKLSAACLLAGALLAPTALQAGEGLEQVPVVTGLDATGLIIGFDTKGNNTRSFKVGNAEVTTTLNKNGSVGIKVSKGTLTLAGPNGESLVTLTENDEIQIDGFLDNAKMFELLHGNDAQMLRLGAIATATFTNLGPRSMNMMIGGQAFAVGAGSGRTDAALGLVYVGPLPRNVLTTLKPGQTVIGLDDNGNPLAITRDRKGGLSRQQLDASSFQTQKTRAGNDLQDVRKITPVIGVPITIKLEDTTLEITGTKDGAIIKVVDGKPLTLGTANAQFVGYLPVGSEIEIAGLSIPGGAFYLPGKVSALLLPVTASYIITNRADTPLTLGKTNEQIRLNKNEKTTGTKCGFSTTTGIKAEDLKKLPAGTGVEIVNGKGEKVFIVVGDALDKVRTDVKEITIINISDSALSLDIFGLGNFICGPGGGMKAPTESLNFFVNNGIFLVQMPASQQLNIRNGGKGNSVITTKKGLVSIQSGHSLDQAQKQQGTTTLTVTTATLILGGKVSGTVIQILNVSTQNTPSTNLPPSNIPAGKKITLTKKTVLIILTDKSGGGSVLPPVILITGGTIIYTSVPNVSP